MAAIVVIFAAILTPKPSFVWGSIRGTEKFPTAAMMANSPFLVGRLSDGGYFHFFAREEEIKGQIFSLSARGNDGALIIIGCIPIDLLKKYLGNSDGLDLTLNPDTKDPDNPRWMLVQTLKSDPLGQWGNPACQTENRAPLKAASLPSRIGDALVPAAHAMPAGTQPSPPLKGMADVEVIFRELEGGDFGAQNRAQDRVARLQDAASIGMVVRAWKEPWKSRADTSLLVAWVRSIRLDRALAVPIASALSQS